MGKRVTVYSVEVSIRLEIGTYLLCTQYHYVTTDDHDLQYPTGPPVPQFPGGKRMIPVAVVPSYKLYQRMRTRRRIVYRRTGKGYRLRSVIEFRAER